MGDSSVTTYTAIPTSALTVDDETLSAIPASLRVDLPTSRLYGTTDPV